MSQQDVEILRECFLAFNERGIQAAVSSFEDLLSEDFGLDEAAEVPDQERHSGRTAFIANLRKFEEEFDELSIVALEFVDLGDKLIVEVLMSGRGRASGARIEATFTQLWTIRDGKAASLHDYASKSAALEAVAEHA